MMPATCRVRCWLLVVPCLLLVATRAWASPSGLNNIPTTDVTPENTLVLQTWTNVGNGLDPELFLGFKYGALDGLEIGLDWKATGDTHSHLTFQGKYGFDLIGDAWRGVVGIANVSNSRKHAGYVFPYVATSYDLGPFRAHLGATAQHDNEGFFVGIDRTVSFLGRDLQLKADAIQINDRDDILYSAGFLYDLRPPKNGADSPRGGLGGLWDAVTNAVILESWVSQPSTGTASLTVKLNYVIEF